MSRSKSKAYAEARANTPAKITTRRLEAWLDQEKNREIIIHWTWNKLNRRDKSGVIIAKENGIELIRKIYQNGNSREPNPDFRSTHSHSHRHRALDILASELEALDLSNAAVEMVSR